MQVRISESTARASAEESFTKKKYLESQAWLVQAILIDNKQATFDFCTQGTIKSADKDTLENYFLHYAEANKIHYEQKSIPTYTYGVFLTTLVAIILGGKKLSYFDKFEIRDNKDICIKLSDEERQFRNLKLKGNLQSCWIKCIQHATIILYANLTTNPTNSITNPDTFLYTIASYGFKKNPRFFLDFMSFCARNNILSLQNYEAILKFINHNAPGEHDLLEEGKRIFIELNARENHRAFLQRQVPSTVNMMQFLQQTPVFSSEPSSILTISDEPPPLYPTDQMYRGSLPSQTLQSLSYLENFNMHALPRSQPADSLEPVYIPSSPSLSK